MMKDLLFELFELLSEATGYDVDHLQEIWFDAESDPDCEMSLGDFVDITLQLDW